MHQRSISAVGVVIVALVPAFMGGPIFAVVLALLCLIGVNEYLAMARHITKLPSPVGYAVVPAFAAAALTGGGAQAVLGVTAIAVGLPFVLLMVRSSLEGSFTDWALGTAGALYLGLPVFAAIALRRSEGAVDANWLDDLAGWASFGWEAAPRGLAWLLFALVVTWLADTGAYIVGRYFGRRPLIPVVSPKKTIEGFIGGMACAALTGGLAVALFGLDVHPVVGGLFGLAIGLISVVGDLAESLLKRQAGVKDSGTLIPGHGGMLDRMDALLFTFTAGWFLASLADRFIT